jgi:hypothetical protein
MRGPVAKLPFVFVAAGLLLIAFAVARSSANASSMSIDFPSANQFR